MNQFDEDVEYVVMFVVQVKKTGKLLFRPVRMLGFAYPENTPDHIMQLTYAANLASDEDDILFVDVAAINVNEKTIYWEEVS